MINLNEIKAKNEFFVSSGALGYGIPWRIKGILVNPSAFGGVVTRTLTPEKRWGNLTVDPVKPDGFKETLLWGYKLFRERPNVLRKIPIGWINALGWWNVGIDYYINEIYPKVKEGNKIVSIGGFSIEEYLEMIEKLNNLEVLAVELNVSCPNVEINWEGDLVLFEKLMEACRNTGEHPLIVKLSVKGNYLQRAVIAEETGINAIHAINTVKGLALNPKTGEPLLKARYGGMSGTTIKPIALRVVSEIKEATRLPIIGGGGIYSRKDCQQFFHVGASAVSFGSIFFFQPWKPARIVRRYQKT